MSRGLLKCLLIMHSYLLFNPSGSADIHGPVDTDPPSVSSTPAASAAAPPPVEPRWVTENLNTARYVRKYATTSPIAPSTPAVFELVTLPQEAHTAKGAAGLQRPQWHPKLPVVQHTLSLAPIHTHAGLRATSPRLLLIPLMPQSDASLPALLQAILPEKVRHLITLGPMPESHRSEFHPLRFTDSRTWNRPVPLTVTSRSNEDLGAGRVSTITVEPEPASNATAQWLNAEVCAGVQAVHSQAFGGMLREEPKTTIIGHLHVDVPTPGLLDPSALRTVSQWLGTTAADGSSVAVVTMGTPGHQSTAGEDLNLMTMGGQLALAMAVRKNAAQWRKDHPKVTENHHPPAMMLGDFAKDLYARHPELLGHVGHLSAQLEIDRSRRDTSFSASGRLIGLFSLNTLNTLRRGAVATPDTKGIRLSSWRPLLDADPLAAQAPGNAKEDGAVSISSTPESGEATSWRSRRSDTETSSASDSYTDSDSDIDIDSTWVSFTDTSQA